MVTKTSLTGAPRAQIAVAVLAVILYLSKLVDPLDRLGVTTLPLRVGVVAAIFVLVAIYYEGARRARLKKLLVTRRVPLCEVDSAVLGEPLTPLAMEEAQDRKVSYVPRNGDDKLRKALETKRVVMLVGESGAGKSATAVAQAREVFGAMPVIVPVKPSARVERPLSEILDLITRWSPWTRGTWLWLDDLGRYLARDAFDVAALVRWLDANPRHRVLITMSGEDQELYLGDKGAAGETARDLVKLAYEHEVPVTWVGEELRLAHVRYPGAGEDAEHLARHLSSGFQQLRRFRNAPLTARAVLRAAVDWRRARFARPVPEAWLRAVFPIYLKSFDGASDLDKVFEDGLSWATERLLQDQDAVLRADATQEGCFTVADIAVEYAERKNIAIPEKVWEHFLDAADSAADLTAVAAAARTYRQDAVAKRALESVLENQAAPAEQQAAARVAWQLLMLPKEQTAQSMRTPGWETVARKDPRGPLVTDEPPPAAPARSHRFLAMVFAHPAVVATARTLLLVAIDVLGLWVALIVAYMVTAGSWPIDWDHARELCDERIPYVALLMVLLFGRAGLYRGESRRGNIARVFGALTEATVALVILRALVGERIGGVAMIAVAFVLACVSVGTLRGLFTLATRRLVLAARGRRSRVVLVGDARSVENVREALKPDAGPRDVIGQVVVTPGTKHPELRCLGYVSEIAQVVETHEVDEVILCDDQIAGSTTADIAAALHDSPARLRALPSARRFLIAASRYLPGEPLPLEELRVPGFDRAQRAVKRTFDVIVAGALMILLSPLCLLIAVLIKFSRGPVLQQISQPGFDGLLVGFYKFRVEYLAADGNASGKLTPVGRVIRRFALDEVPQLINVVRGQMSLVGPRAISAADFDRLPLWQKRRYLVPPGVTGFWQISGRRDQDFADMVRLDLYYVQRWSLYLDVEILLKTVPATLRGRRAALRVPLDDPLIQDGAPGPELARFERRAPFGEAVLRLLPAADGVMLGEILDAVGDLASQPGEVLRWMARLDQRGWMEIAPPQPDDGGRAVRFRLSPAGVDYLSDDPRSRPASGLVESLTP